MARSNIVKRRPAESLTLAAAVALLAAKAFNLDADVEVALVVVVGAIPAVVTWVVDRVRGA